MIHGYCGDCDKLIELHTGTAYIDEDDDGYKYINIKCPWCEDYEEVPIR